MQDIQMLLAQVARGATVYDASGEKIGTITDIDRAGSYIEVEKGWLFHKDFYVPLSDVSRVDELGGVFLTINKHDLGAAYDEPPIPDKTRTPFSTSAADTISAGMRTPSVTDTEAESDEADVSDDWQSAGKGRTTIDEDF